MKITNSHIEFEDGIKELENIIEKLDSNDLNLEDSLQNFEKGIILYKNLSKILNEAEGKIKLILDNGEESLKEIDFNENM